MKLHLWIRLTQPFGEGLVTVVVPQLRRGENSLLLWSLSDLTNPVHTFIGHSDVVLEFDWKRTCQGKASLASYQEFFSEIFIPTRCWRLSAGDVVQGSKPTHLAGRLKPPEGRLALRYSFSDRLIRLFITILKLCGYVPDNEPPIVFGENDSTVKVSSKRNYKLFDFSRQSLKRETLIGIATISPSCVKDIETGLEVGEETLLIKPIHLPEALRMPNVKGVAVSIAAAQAALTSTVLSPTSHRKKNPGSSCNNSLNGDAPNNGSIGEIPYSFAEEIDQIKAIGIFIISYPFFQLLLSFLWLSNYKVNYIKNIY